MGQDLMQQRKISASLQLMQDLLTCPAGEEWILLKRHEDVVDADFVQLMEQVATQLQQEGDRQAATFLRNWAAQLHHVLLREALPQMSGFQPSQAQLALIQQLIDAAPEDLDQLLTESTDLVQPELVKAIHQVAQQLAEQGKTRTAQLLEQLAFRVNQAWIQSHLAPASSMRTTTDNSQESKAEAKLTEPATVASKPPIEQREAIASAPSVEQTQPEKAAQTLPEPMGEKRSSTTLKQRTFKTLSDNQSAAQPDLQPDPWQGDAAPMSSALQLKVPQQIANGLHEVTLLLHALNKSIAAQTAAIQTLTQTAEKALDTGPSDNPLWYMDVLEQAQSSDWIISTDELTHLIGVRPQCHGDETYYVRGCWKFEKVGKLGSQTAWRVHKY